MLIWRLHARYYDLKQPVDTPLNYSYSYISKKKNSKYIRPTLWSRTKYFDNLKNATHIFKDSNENKLHATALNLISNFNLNERVPPPTPAYKFQLTFPLWICSFSIPSSTIISNNECVFFFFFFQPRAFSAFGLIQCCIIQSARDRNIYLSECGLSRYLQPFYRRFITGYTLEIPISIILRSFDPRGLHKSVRKVSLYTNGDKLNLKHISVMEFSIVDNRISTCKLRFACFTWQNTNDIQYKSTSMCTLAITRCCNVHACMHAIYSKM